HRRRHRSRPRAPPGDRAAVRPVVGADRSRRADDRPLRGGGGAREPRRPYAARLTRAAHGAMTATMPVERLSATASGADVAAVLARDGCAIVERLVPPALLDRARAELEPHLAATPVGPDVFSGRRTRRTGGLVARSATCRDVVMHPVTL